MKFSITAKQESSLSPLNMPALINNKPQVSGEQGGSVRAATTTKIRRTRQARNPQLSVARRNERERNRVKMVNNGFALLREHLPIEDLRACEQQQDSDGCDTQSSNGDAKGQNSANKRAKKFSKVETLRAAIARIRMLEELIRSTEPTFESMNINIHQQNNQPAGYDDSEMPLSVGEPLSCASSEARSNSTSGLTTINSHYIQEQQHYQHQQVTMSAAADTGAYVAPASEHFIKLEPQYQHQQQLPSPQGSQSSHTSYQPPSTVQHVEPSHTHLWIEQHQNSFMEQQQYQQQQQRYGQVVDQHTQQAMHPNNQPTQSPGSQQQQMDSNNSPVYWFPQSIGSPSSHHQHQQAQTHQQFASLHNPYQQHQISLYSQ